MTDYTAHIETYQSLVKPLTPGVFPLRNKRPLPGSHGHLDASWSLGQFDGQHWSHVGLALSDKLCVVDVDDWQCWRGMLAGHEPPRTLMVATRRGFHMYFTWQGGDKPRLPVGVDFKARGGYVVAPGWEPYRVLEPDEPANVRIEVFYDRTQSSARLDVVPVAYASLSIAPLPEWIETMRVRRPSVSASSTGSGRNVALTSACGKLRALGYEEKQILTWGLQANQDFAEPLSDREVETIAASVCRYPKGIVNRG